MNNFYLYSVHYMTVWFLLSMVLYDLTIDNMSTIKLTFSTNIFHFNGIL
jgi:hypothetical protein